jgi:ferredoxin-NADP reductase/CRP-like cAMP-binding protein
MSWRQFFSDLAGHPAPPPLDPAQATVEQILQHSGLFRALDAPTFAELCASVSAVEYDAGQVILREGDVGDAMYLIQRGSVRISTTDGRGDDVVLARLEPGAYFGEQALIDEQPQRRSATAIALTNVGLVRVPREWVRRAIGRDAKLGQTLRTEGERQLLERISVRSAALRAMRKSSARSLPGGVRRYDDGAIICAQGDPADAVYAILDGVVELHFDGAGTESVSTSRLTTGQIFGERGVLKKQPRTATAQAIGTVRLLAIDADVFRRLHASTPELQGLTSALERVYDVPRRGTVTQLSGDVDGVESVTTIIVLTDGGVALASQVVARSIFTLSRADTQGGDTEIFEDGSVRREITVLDNRIVGIASGGSWPAIGVVCGLLLDGAPLQPWQLPLFSRTGELFPTEETAAAGSGATLCHCMQVDRQTVVDAIRAGAADVDAVTQRTGAGSVCGACRSDVSRLLGRSSWAMVYVASRDVLCRDIRRYRLRPFEGGVQHFAPGQHILLQALIDRHWVERAYTLTSPPHDDCYEIAIKRESQGYFSRWLFDNDTSPTLLLRVSPPQGRFTLDPREKTPAIALVAGIGVTPAVAFARALAGAHADRPLHVIYSARSPEQHAFASEMTQLAEAHPRVTVTLRVTSRDGRLAAAEIADLCRAPAQPEFFVCGPDTFMTDVCQALAAAGVPNARVRTEHFSPAGSPLARKRS